MSLKINNMKRYGEQEALSVIGCPALLISVNEVERMRKNDAKMMHLACIIAL